MSLLIKKTVRVSSCTCKKILKLAKKENRKRLPKGTYQTPKHLTVELNYTGNEKKRNRSKYMGKYYKAHNKALKTYQAIWWRKYGKQYSRDNKEHQKIINCQWLVRTGRIKL